MPTVIDEASVEVTEPPAPPPRRETPPRQPPDMARIRAELGREAERLLRQWCD